MREQIKELWKLCFPEDTEDFVDLYFSSRYTDGINSAIVENGKVLSALQRIPYPMKYLNQVIPVAYISGACTHPDFRSMGLMSRLLDSAHKNMYADGKCLSVLIPADEGLVNYYSRFGYEVCFQQNKKLLTGIYETVDNYNYDLIFSEIELKDKELSEVCNFINQQLSTQQVCILHPLQDMMIVVSDIYLSGGHVWCLRTGDGKLCAVTLVVVAEGQVVVKELLSVDKRAEAAMIDFLFRHYSVSLAEKTSPCGMVRVINVCRMLEILAGIIEGKLVVEIFGDNVITENNGFYIISNGVCRKTDGRTEYDCDTIYQKIHINRLPLWLFRDMQPYMSLMLD